MWSMLLLACAEGVPAVRVAIVDPDGAPYAGARVEYRVDQGDYESAECATGAEPEACTAYVAGRGEVGQIQVAAVWEGGSSSACCWYYSFDSKTVDVTADVFGAPVSQRITLTVNEQAEICGDCGYGY